MVEAANFRLLQFYPAPLGRVGFGHLLDDVNNFRPGGDTLLPKLKEARVSGGAGLAGILEDSMLSAPGTGGDFGRVITTARLLGRRGGRWRPSGRRLAETAHDFGYHVADKRFVNCAHDLSFGVIDFLPQDIHRIHDSDDDRIHRRIFEIRREARGTSLAEQYHLANSSPHAVNSHDGVDAGPELCRVLVVHKLWSQQEQLAPADGSIFLGCHYRTLYSC